MLLLIAIIGAYVFALDQIIFHNFRIGGFFQTLLIVTAALVVAFLWVGRRLARPRQKAQSRAKSAVPARTAPAPAEPAEKVVMFNVAGTTFTNDDGTSRQKILRALKFGDEPYADRTGLLNADIEETTFDGELALAVSINGYMVGYVPKARIPQVKKALDSLSWSVNSVDIVGGGATDGGKQLSFGCTTPIRYTD